MANIAQTINVLQAMILTDGDKMLLTPTYYVFEMFKGHQDGEFLPVHDDFDTIQNAPVGSVLGRASTPTQAIPQASASATRKDGRVTLSLANPSHDQTLPLSVELRGTNAKVVSARVLSHGQLNAHNTFESPETLSPRALEVSASKDGRLSLDLPAASVAIIELA
jgi:alpha-N-arabinofuranosidase